MVVDPAYAGMILCMRQEVPALNSGPRVCGDDPNGIPDEWENKKWTPRMRG